MDLGEVLVALYGHAAEAAPYVWQASLARAEAAATLGKTCAGISVSLLFGSFVFFRTALRTRTWDNGNEGLVAAGVVCVIVALIIGGGFFANLDSILCPEYTAIEYAKQAFKPW